MGARGSIPTIDLVYSLIGYSLMIKSLKFSWPTFSHLENSEFIINNL